MFIVFQWLKKANLLVNFLLLNLFISLTYPLQVVFANLQNAELSENQLTTIDTAIKKISPKFNIKNSSINFVPDANLYQIIFNQTGEIFYISRDNRYFFYGELIDLNNNDQKKRNLTELSRMFIRKSEISQFPTSKMIIFKAKNHWPKKPVNILTIFTDLDCPYANRLYKELQKANELGIEIRYLLFPRQGLSSESYKKSVSVWCSKNRNKAFSMANQGENISPTTCKNNPIEDQFNLAVKIGIQGTPSIILQNGTIIPGYVSYNKLLSLLEENNASSNS